MKIKLIITMLMCVVASIIAEAKPHGPPPCRPRGGYYRLPPRRPHITTVVFDGPCYGANPYLVHGNFRVYEKPVAARRYYTTTTTTVENNTTTTTTTTYERAPVTSYYQPAPCWQPGVVIPVQQPQVQTQVTETVVPVDNNTYYSETVYVYPEREPLIDIGAKVKVLGVGVQAGVEL